MIFSRILMKINYHTTGAISGYRRFGNVGTSWSLFMVFFIIYFSSRNECENTEKLS